jgi:hypothetical protein
MDDHHVRAEATICEVCLRPDCCREHRECSPRPACTRCGEQLRCADHPRLCGFCREEIGIAARLAPAPEQIVIAR